ncbi:MAG: hypothetical protein ABSA16_04215 [Thermoguttaceae bacterium]
MLFKVFKIVIGCEDGEIFQISHGTNQEINRQALNAFPSAGIGEFGGLYKMIRPALRFLPERVKLAKYRL